MDILPVLPFALPVGDYFVLLGIFVFAATLLNVSAFLIFRAFLHVAGRTKTELDNKIIHKLKLPLHIFAFLSAAYFAIQYSFPNSNVLGVSVLDEYVILFYALLAISLNRVIDVFLVWYGKEIVPHTESKMDDEVFPLLRNIVRIIIYLVFIVFILERLGIAIAPLLAGLGIAGLAVGLALQDTLTNFFAGVHILTDKPFKEGDFVSLENGSVSGVIDTIGWRSTKIRTIDNNHVILPNAKLAQSIVVNYHTPSLKSQIVADINVSYESDIEKVESVILSVLKSLQTSDEFVSKDDEPWVRFEKFGDYSIVFRYGFQIIRFDKRFGVVHELNKRLFHAFKKNGINVPYPVMTILKEKK